ncbi:MAG: Gfo/Idh/MocA family oxidoreductase [Synoicihabitans sp.]
MSRRTFVGSTAAASVATLLATPSHVFAAHHADRIKIGLIGAGDRGTVSAGIIDCAEADPTIELVAMGDLFEDHLQAAPANIEKAMGERGLPFKDIFKVTPDRMFSGFDAYQRVIECDVDLIILATPPVFRPLHFKAAVQANKHVFVEKPIAVDGPGVRDFLATTALAKQKGLTVVAGTQMRRATHLQEVVEYIREGGIGEAIAGHSVRVGGGLMNFRSNEAIRDRNWSDMEWQLRRWLFSVWASGDFIVEQHVHNLDLLNWAMGGPPVKASGFGGRQTRTDSIYLNVWDHMSVEYEYANGASITHFGAQVDGIAHRNDMRIQGDKGELLMTFGRAEVTGAKAKKFPGSRTVKPPVQQYKETLDSIRNSRAINEGKQIAETTMTAILGRQAAYSGRAVSWGWAMNASQETLTPPVWEWGDLPLKPPAVPGRYKLT